MITKEVSIKTLSEPLTIGYTNVDSYLYIKVDYKEIKISSINDVDEIIQVLSEFKQQKGNQ